MERSWVYASRKTFNLPFCHHTIDIDLEHSSIRWLRMEAMRKDEIEIAAALRPFDIACGRIGFRMGMRMIIDHIAIVRINIIVNTYNVGFADNREIIRMFGSISGRIIFYDLTVN